MSFTHLRGFESRGVPQEGLAFRGFTHLRGFESIASRFTDLCPSCFTRLRGFESASEQLDVCGGGWFYPLTWV